MTKCQITCKFLQKSSKCQNFLRVWHLVIFRADQLKKPPCMSFVSESLLKQNIFVCFFTTFKNQSTTTIVKHIYETIENRYIIRKSLEKKGKNASVCSNDLIHGWQPKPYLWSPFKIRVFVVLFWNLWPTFSLSSDDCENFLSYRP